jgi:hypothetical protein
MKISLSPHSTMKLGSTSQAEGGRTEEATIIVHRRKPAKSSVSTSNFLHQLGRIMSQIREIKLSVKKPGTSLVIDALKMQTNCACNLEATRVLFALKLLSPHNCCCSQFSDGKSMKRTFPLFAEHFSSTKIKTEAIDGTSNIACTSLENAPQSTSANENISSRRASRVFLLKFHSSVLPMQKQSVSGVSLRKIFRKCCLFDKLDFVEHNKFEHAQKPKDRRRCSSHLQL